MALEYGCLALLNALMCIINVSKNSVQNNCGTHAITKVHETADLKTDIKACLHKHMVTKISLSL